MPLGLLAYHFYFVSDSSCLRRVIFFPVAMLRTASCSASLTSASPFFRHFPLSYSSLSSSTGALRGPGRNLRRVAPPASPGRRVFLRRGLRVPSAAVRRVNRQLSRLYVRAVATQPAPSYPGKDSHFVLSFIVGWFSR